MDYIEIKGYKSIKDAKIDISPINILIGANGSGKSNFVSFFEFLNSLYHQSLSIYVGLKGGEDKVLFQGKKTTDELYFHLEFNGEVNGYSALLKVGTEGFIFLEENLIYEGNKRNINVGAKESKIKSTDNFCAPYVMKYLNGFRKYHFHDTSSKSPFTQYSSVRNDTAYFYTDGRNIAAYLYHIRETNRIVYNRIVKNIQSIAPYFSDFELIPNDELLLRLQWRDKFSDVIYGVNDLSDGTLRFIALSVLFLQPNLPDTIIIDEPELGLHPFAITKLAGMIKSASKRDCQVIVATQSPELISNFEPEDIVTVDQINGETRFCRQNREQLSVWLNDYYTIGDLWKRNMITGGQPNYSL